MKAIDLAIQHLDTMKMDCEELMRLMEDSYAEGVVLGDGGNIELAIELENNVNTLAGRFRKIRNGT